MKVLSPYFLFLFLVAPLMATGQPRETQAAEPLVGNWLRAQKQVGARLLRVSCMEQVNHVVDSPRGVRRTQTEVLFISNPTTDHATREVRQATVDGKTVPLEELREWEERRAFMMKPYLQASDWLLAPPQRLFEHVRPVGQLMQEALGSQRALRLDFSTPEEDSPLERLTAWFSADGERLLRTRLIYLPMPDALPLQVVTDFIRREGLDLPVRRVTEGTMQYKRRTRTYTVLVNVDTRYSNYRIDWR